MELLRFPKQPRENFLFGIEPFISADAIYLEAVRLPVDVHIRLKDPEQGTPEVRQILQRHREISIFPLQELPDALISPSFQAIHLP